MPTYRKNNVTDARNRFAEVVDQVYYQGDIVVLCKSGKAVTVMVSIDFFEQFTSTMETAVKYAQAATKNLSNSD